MKDEAIQLLIKKFEMKYSRAEKLVEKYFSVCSKELSNGYLYATRDQLECNYIPFQIEKVKDLLRFRVKNKTYNLFNELPYIEIIEKGNNLKHQRTIVMSMIDIDGAMPTPIINDSEGDIEKIVIDEKSLSNYIRNTESLNSTNKIIMKNLKYAYALMSLHNEYGYIPHIINESAFGRRYYKGVNLMNAPSIVREAALGKIWRVDINNAAFQWRYNSIEQIDPTFPKTYLIDYLSRKEQIRIQIANDVYHDSKYPKEQQIKKIKAALAALSFGAKAENTSFYGAPALADIFGKNKVQLDRFINHEFVRPFYEELKAINKKIHDFVKDDIKSIPEIFDIVKTDTNRISKSKLLAYFYQKQERVIMEDIINKDFIKDKVLLWVHDGFYAKGLSLDDKADLRYLFEEYGYEIDIELRESYKLASRSMDLTDEQIHKNLIQQEELRAKNYHKDNTLKDNTLKVKGKYSGLIYVIEDNERRRIEEYIIKIIETNEVDAAVSLFEEVRNDKCISIKSLNEFNKGYEDYKILIEEINE